MFEFGCSLTCHYRRLNSVSNIENLCSFFVKNEEINILELGFGGASNYELFYRAYLDSKILKVADKYKTSINLHLQRNDWELIGPKKIVFDLKSLMREFKIDYFIIHETEFKKYKNLLKFISNKLYIENNDLADCHLIKSDTKIVCDINHFYINKELDIINLNKFIANHKSRIKEFHFSYQNHDVFDEKSIVFLVNIFDNIKGTINLDNKKIIFEGTDRSKNKLRDFKRTLNINFKLIKKSLNLCLQ